MKNKRKWSVDEKMAIVLEGIRGKTSVSELCRKYGISQSQYYKWRDIFFEYGRRGLEDPKNRHNEMLQKKIEELEKIIGKQTIVIETLKKTRFVSEE